MVVAPQPRIKDRWSPTGRTETSQPYYMVRTVVSQYEDYWAPRKDPDGVMRDRTSEAERIQYIDDVRYITDFVNSLKPQTVLDVGAGLGWMLAEINAVHRLAIEDSTFAIQSLLRSGITVVGDVELLPDASCDVVICHHVIEHLRDPIRVVATIRKLLKPGGWLVLGTPDFGSPCAVRFGTNYRMLHDPTHCSLFTRASCERMLLNHGFGIDRVEYPFPNRYATAETMARWTNTSTVSPPWPGNWMTFFCKR